MTEAGASHEAFEATHDLVHDRVRHRVAMRTAQAKTALQFATNVVSLAFGGVLGWLLWDGIGLLHISVWQAIMAVFVVDLVGFAFGSGFRRSSVTEPKP